MSDVRQWLEAHGLEKYRKVFLENDIGLDIVATLTEDDLKELGFTLGDRKRLQSAVAQLATVDAGSRTPEVRSEDETPSRDPERRQLTVMFCDLVGSTALSQQLDPEELREIIKACHDAWRENIVRYEGFVARYMGDGILAYFGYPLAHEDDAERAVHAGLGVVQSMESITLEAGRNDVRLEVRVGIATGPVVVGDLIGEGASRESPVSGQTPNLAARLQAEADPNTVVISNHTYSLTRGRFQCRALGEKKLKGIARPACVWRVVAPGVTESRFEARAGGRATSLVGRQTEVELLMERWRQAKEGETQVVLLCGEPGIGKSRIAQTILERVASEPHTRLRYQCSPYHTNSALHPIIDQLNRTIQIETENTGTGKLDALASMFKGAQGQHEEVVALFADLLSIPTEGRYPDLDVLPQRRKELTIDAMLRQIEELACQAPVLFIMEDLHWVDPTTMEVVGRLLDEINESRILVLLTFRPEFTVPWPLHANFTTLTLNRLSRRQCVEMIDRHTGGKPLPQEVVDQIIEKTDGVPLFLEELTRAVLESDLLADEADEYVLKDRFLPLAIPSTLQDSLMARLDRLGPAKEVAQVGSVIGREFSHPLLDATIDMESSRLDHALEQLIDSGLVFRRGSSPDSTYIFKHALVQDAAYQSLLKTKRRGLHSRIVSVLEEGFAGVVRDQPELMAHHATQAGMAATAVDHWLRAGERDAQRSSNVEAIASLSKGLALVGDLPQGPERDQAELSLLIALGPALMATDGWDAKEVDDTYSRARLLAYKTNQPTVLFPSLWGLWLVAHAGGKPAQAGELLKEILDLAENHKDNELLLQAYHAGGSENLAKGFLPEAQRFVEEGIALYSESEHRAQALRYGGHDPCVCAHSIGALNQFIQGNLEAAERFSQSALELAARVEHRPSVAHAFLYRAELSHLRGQETEARHCAERALEIAEPFGMNQYAAWAQMLIGWSRAISGEAQNALREVEAGLRRVRGLGVRYHLAHRILLWAESLAAAGRIEDAVAAADDALAVSRETGERWFEPEIFRLKARLLSAAGPTNTDEAVDLLNQAMKCAEDMGAKLWRLRASSAWVCLTPDDGGAKAVLAATLKEFEEGLDAPELRTAEALLGQLR